MEKVTFEGWDDCVRLTNGTVEVIVTTTIGPRIVRYGFLGGPNAFHLAPDDLGQTGGDQFRVVGGHRFWVAPEAVPRTTAPDTGHVGSMDLDGEGVLRIGNAPERVSGMAKEIAIRLAPDGAGVAVTHRVTNRLVWPVQLACWGLNVVANGGFIVFPQEPYAAHEDDLLPARPLVLWKYTDLSDERFGYGPRFITLKQGGAAGKPQKIGIYNSLGWAAHVAPEQVFVVLIDVESGGPAVHTDMGCNFEAYTDGPFQELETLGPFVTLEPGRSTTFTEYWSLIAAQDVPAGEPDLGRRLSPIVAQALADKVRLKAVAATPPALTPHEPSE
jgi:hypothetical protein